MVIHWDVLDPTSKAAKRSLQKRNEMSVVVACVEMRVIDHGLSNRPMLEGVIL